MLIETVDAARLEVSPTLDPKRRAKLGQFMTPGPTAKFMAQMFDNLPEHVRLLDAGAGMGALTAAFVVEACNRADAPKSISVTCYEVDEDLASILSSTLDTCADVCREAGVEFSSEIIRDDYILRSAEPHAGDQVSHNVALLNPPYGKIRSNSKWRLALRQCGIETVNLYSAFVALANQQIEAGGQIVAITPRSFCNGTYYEPFRKQILDDCALEKLHVYESRRSTFKDDDVLQENMIFHLTRGGDQGDIALSTDKQDARAVPFEEIVRPEDKHRFIRLPIDGNSLAAKIQALPCTLADLGIKASTGRVVDFRTREHLMKEPEGKTVPMIHAQHFKDGAINWPLKDFKKCNYLADSEETAKLMVPAGTYVIVKRFSAKEEKRRLVGALYDGGKAGFDNKTNYFHMNGGGLPKDVAKGLLAFLSSEAVDQYFRIFSGHTQVNATDLRNLHYPSLEQLRQIGMSNSGPDEAVEAILQPAT
ncbi:Eco57I restriction-modification methylase domain-containing protein [Ruegeria sp. HKCCE4148]|uniref:Eco57I restriction-modification methylase domain-containing protein n=1 Tax=Ruegeria sp. HKCCE4148 TaxID=2794829 RepID=UPI001AE8A0BC|nr:Eco57I restriction-modification methylase domain-containing protein [Ruegeria sp. HKCCE4148]